MRIPITMCHGVTAADKSLPKEHFGRLMAIVAEMGFESVNYDDLAAWREGTGELPGRPIMIDLDHPERSVCDVKEEMDRYGLKGTLFIQTGRMDELYSAPLPPDEERDTLTWDEILGFVADGWLIGAHTVTHPNLSELFKEDPEGERIAAELDECNATLAEHLGAPPKDFAFTGTSWSSVAEREVMKRYRFGRLWIVGSMYKVDGKPMRYADLVGAEGADEPDGGPPIAARYITRESNPYRLPSMELQRIINTEDAFRAYLAGALAT